MKMTAEEFEIIICKYNDLVSLANKFAIETGKIRKYESIRLDEYGNIEAEVNTACNCHPEYEWSVIATREEFLNWLINK